MADASTGGPARGTGGTNLVLVLLVVVVLALVAWLVMGRGGDEADVEVNVPSVEAPEVDPPDVEVKSGDDK
jgi:hypothetical protein